MTFQRAFRPVAIFCLLLWNIQIVAWLSGGPIVRLGIFPLDFGYLGGVLTAPLIHSGWEHLVANTLPILFQFLDFHSIHCTYLAAQ